MVVETRTGILQQTRLFSTRRKKQNLIDQLDVYLREAGIEVKHAGDEGDADVVIIHTALDLAEDYDMVWVLS